MLLSENAHQGSAYSKHNPDKAPYRQTIGLQKKTDYIYHCSLKGDEDRGGDRSGIGEADKQGVHISEYADSPCEEKEKPIAHSGLFGFIAIE